MSTDSLEDEEGRAAALAYFDATLNEMLKEKKVLRVDAPSGNDVLCGRGHFTNYHQGNRLLRSLVKAIRVDYVLSKKKDKKHFSEFIVRRISGQDPPGRFLKKDPKNDTWIDIGHKKALIKIRQALRDGANKLTNAELEKAKEKLQRKIASQSSVETDENKEALVEEVKKTPSKSSSNTSCNSDRVVTSSVEIIKKTPSKSSSIIPCNSDTRGRIVTSSVENIKKTPPKSSSNTSCNSDRFVTSSVEDIKKTSPNSSSNTSCNSDRFVTSSAENIKKTPPNSSSNTSCNSDRFVTSAAEKIKKTPPNSSSNTSCNSDRFDVASSKCTRLYYAEEVYSSEFIPTD